MKPLKPNFSINICKTLLKLCKFSTLPLNLLRTRGSAPSLKIHTHAHTNKKALR